MLYFFVVESIVLLGLLYFSVTAHAPRPYSAALDAVFGVLYFASSVLLLVTTPLLLRVERWLGLAAFVTVLLVFVVALLSPAIK